jgi:hypothetical protein
MLKSMRLGIVAIVAAATLAIWTGAQAGDEKGHGLDKDHVMVRPDDIKWGPALSALPAGHQDANLSASHGLPAPSAARDLFRVTC